MVKIRAQEGYEIRGHRSASSRGGEAVTLQRERR